MQRYRKIIVLMVLLCGIMHVYAREAATDSIAHQQQRIFSGCSGGMMLHVGYLFAPNCAAMFGNEALGQRADLPRDGVTFGIGGAAKVHLKDCIHIGSEGFVSTMPLMGNDSQVRTGWGGVLLDYYWTRDRFRPFAGFTIGGGSMRRLLTDYATETNGQAYPHNAYFRKTGFMFVGPYIGFEYALTPRVAVVCRVDYVVPFGRHMEQEITYMSPSGPRLYVGFMFGHAVKKKK